MISASSRSHSLVSFSIRYLLMASVLPAKRHMRVASLAVVCNKKSSRFFTVTTKKKSWQVVLNFYLLVSLLRRYCPLKCAKNRPLIQSSCLANSWLKFQVLYKLDCWPATKNFRISPYNIEILVWNCKKIERTLPR